ncbi:MAG: hypothetical protein IPM74_17020 [Crocinitomicaceae bacterium]|nr:hypothetical protein [Crocinitomicaceae bacterium]
MNFERIFPDSLGNWLNITDSDLHEHMSIFEKGKKSFFLSISNGVSTNRDEWVFDFDKKNLQLKSAFFCKTYNDSIKQGKLIESVKWSRDLKNEFDRASKVEHKNDSIAHSFYRPFVRKYLYNERTICDVLTANHYNYYGSDLNTLNPTILISSGQRDDFSVFCTNHLASLDVFMPNSTKLLPFKAYDANGIFVENISDWSLNKFRKHYDNKKINKMDLFHYFYAILHCEKYKQDYQTELKRGLPRLPYYSNFEIWKDKGNP